MKNQNQGVLGFWGFGVSGPNPVSALLETGSTDREANMWLFAEHGLGLLHRALTEAEDS